LTLTSEKIREICLHHGFDDVGHAPLPEVWEASDRLIAFLEAGHHGTMQWMKTRAHERSHPNCLWPEAKSCLVLAKSYGPSSNPLEKLKQTHLANFTVYSEGDDYHDVIKKSLKALAADLIDLMGGSLKVFVDTAPLMEKPLGQWVGLGWQGKHTNLVSRRLGNWFFIGVILTDQELPATVTETDHCGSCRSCLDICPTNAFVAPYQLDARRCLSYLTIEFDGPWPDEFRSLMGNRIYGCDDCLAICPWNKFATVANDIKLTPRPSLKDKKLSELAYLNDEEFRALFSKSAIKRIKLRRFLRNIGYGLGNEWRQTHNQEAHTALIHLCQNPDPVIADAGTWGLKQVEGA
jgi:epoxyqueuosine reductase